MTDKERGSLFLLAVTGVFFAYLWHSCQSEQKAKEAEAEAQFAQATQRLREKPPRHYGEALERIGRVPVYCLNRGTPGQETCFFSFGSKHAIHVRTALLQGAVRNGSAVEGIECDEKGVVSSCVALPPKRPTLGVARATVQEGLEPLGFRFEPSSDVDGEHRSMGKAANGDLAELIGDDDALTSVTMLAGAKDSKQAALHTLSLVAIVLPKVPNADSEFSSLMEKAAQDGAGKATAS